MNNVGKEQKQGILLKQNKFLGVACVTALAATLFKKLGG